MGQLNSFVKRNWFPLFVIGIVGLSMVLRFYNYEGRWGFAHDQAHGAIIGRYAAEHFKLPLVGPFSSAGPFQTGGEWYWFIMMATSFYSDLLLTPWVVLTFSYVVFVFLLIIVGKELVNKPFGIIVGLLAAVSTAQIAQSVNLTNQSPLAVMALFAIWAAIRYAKTQSLVSLFFLGLSIGISPTIHLQGIGLFFLIPVTLALTGLPSNIKLLALALGVIIPFIPLLIFDVQNDFVNSQGILQYILYDQYKVSFDVLGRRWLTYIGVFWPNAWTHIIGGIPFVGYVQFFLLGGVGIYSFLRKEISRPWFIILLSFLGMIVLVRYTRTPLFDSYLVFLHPFIFLLVGWVIFFLYRIRKILGLALLIIIVIGSSQKDIGELGNGENTLLKRTTHWKTLMFNKYKDKKFAIYDYEYKTASFSLPLVLLLDVEDRLDDDGYKIGFRNPPKEQSQDKDLHEEIKGNRMGFMLVDLDSSSSAELAKAGWAFVNPSAVYKATQEWYKDKQ